jgi:Collagen triple helix repeat (20 copies)
MKKRLRPSITYANVVASIALFLALCGGAYAASQLPKNSVGSTQLKKGAVTAAKVKPGSLLASSFKAGQLPAGPQGARGEQGPRGAQGKEGTPGKEGEQGKTGPPGSPWTIGVLPSGASMQGAFTIATTVTTLQERVGTQISFGIPLASAPTANFIYAGDTPPAACPGTVAVPKAAPGNLCIYEGMRGNIELEGVEDPVTGATNGTARAFGASVVGISTAIGDVNSSGSWAVTAP